MMLVSPNRSLHICALFSAILCSICICPIESLSLYKSTLSTKETHSCRRAFISVAVTAASAILSPQQSQALQKKNEALCGTGFFEHIYEYKCTTIGDISDEAKSKSMDEKMEVQTDLLMEKLNSSDKKDTPKTDAIGLMKEEMIDKMDEK